MRNADRWVPTKFEFSRKRLRGSRDPHQLIVSSRLITDISASLYQRYLPAYARGHLADLGCGNVPFYHVYKDLIRESTCADWPNTAHRNEYLDVECDLNQPLPFADAVFDTILVSEVLEHLSSPELMWSEMARTLKPGGSLILSVPFFYRIHEEPHDYYRYTEFALKRFAEKNRLKVLELESYGGLPEILTDIFAKNLIRIPGVGSAFSRALQSACWWFVHTPTGKRVSLKSGTMYPLGYFMVAGKS